MEHIELPELFTFPFYYEPHEIAKLAAEELQEYITQQKDWVHNFGLAENKQTKESLAIGKMFGVLVVKNQDGKLGYLCAFSGKLAGGNHHEKFVPPVYDMLVEGDFFQKGGTEIININKQLEKMENNPIFLELKKEKENQIAESSKEISALKNTLKTAKKERKVIRTKAINELSPQEYAVIHDQQKTESLSQQFYLKKVVERWDKMLLEIEKKLHPFEDEIAGLKLLRKEKSAALQERLFKEYKFLNSKGKEKSLLTIFENTALKRPPAGAGECAAPKLLQYAFLNSLQPIALAEFWWGTSPSTDIKKHLNFYPACRGKCEPILTHMLDGTSVESNPLLETLSHDKKIEIIYSDTDLLVINKPEELLSVPGKTISDCVYERIKALYPSATGPLVVHRLDMSTSGLMLIALNKLTYEHLQRQFIKRQIKKRYVAVLDGIPKSYKGKIELPLCLDITDRPRQMVSFENGKKATTEFEIIETVNGKTKIYFYPLTGRTHQLRMHASHHLGLNCPILGDDLYGKKENRLHLHAEKIVFTHPKTKKILEFTSKVPF